MTQFITRKNTRGKNAPRHYEIAVSEIGVHEIPGIESNLRVVEYLETVTGGFDRDENSWCSAFVNWCVEKAGLIGTKSAAARSWRDWGTGVDFADAVLGDIVVLWRESIESWKGHVGLFAGWTDGGVRLLGGNQKDSVCYSVYPKERILAIRRAA